MLRLRGPPHYIAQLRPMFRRCCRTIRIGRNISHRLRHRRWRGRCQCRSPLSRGTPRPPRRKRTTRRPMSYRSRARRHHRYHLGKASTMRRLAIHLPSALLWRRYHCRRPCHRRRLHLHPPTVVMSYPGFHRINLRGSQAPRTRWTMLHLGPFLRSKTSIRAGLIGYGWFGKFVPLR